MRAKEFSRKGPQLRPGETLLWSGRPDCLEYLLFWLPRSALPAAIWIAIWLFVATKQIQSEATSFATYFPLVFVAIGFIWILTWGTSALSCKRFSYFITSQRVIIFNSFTRISWFVARIDIDAFEINEGWRASYGTLRIVAGWAQAPDSRVEVALKLIAINISDTTIIAISKEKTNG